jgi:hypothetical protein
MQGREISAAFQCTYVETIIVFHIYMYKQSLLQEWVPRNGIRETLFYAVHRASRNLVGADSPFLFLINHSRDRGNVLDCCVMTLARKRNKEAECRHRDCLLD